MKILIYTLIGLIFYVNTVFATYRSFHLSLEDRAEKTFAIVMISFLFIPFLAISFKRFINNWNNDVELEISNIEMTTGKIAPDFLIFIEHFFYWDLIDCNNPNCFKITIGSDYCNKCKNEIIKREI